MSVQKQKAVQVPQTGLDRIWLLLKRPLLDCLYRLKFDPTVAQKGQTGFFRGKLLKKGDKRLDEDALHGLALHYVGRYATTRHKLTAYLHRKIRERGWKSDVPVAIDQLVSRFAELGYVDDAQFARNRARALAQRGYGSRRVEQALYQAGIAEADRGEALDFSRSSQWESARRFAEKRSIGPYAKSVIEPEKRQKQLQAFMRAGHDFDIARKFVFAEPGAEIDPEGPFITVGKATRIASLG